MNGDEKVRKPRFVDFIASDAPAQAQSIDIEKWKKERNEEMAALNTITLYKEDGKTINVNKNCVEDYVKKGWSITPVTDTLVEKKPVTGTPVEKKLKPAMYPSTGK